KNFKEAIASYQNAPLSILVLSDQSPGDSRKAYWMNFLNQPTAVLFGAEQLAHQYDFSVIFYKTSKIKRGHYEMKLEVLTTNPRTKNWGEITEAHVKRLEQAILANPEYWLWSHKRWKREIPYDLKELKIEQHAKFNHRYKS